MKMKFLALTGLGLCLGISCNSTHKTVSEKTPEVTIVDAEKTFAETITETELKEHLYTYASDEYQGRETGKEGQKMAAAYLKNEYEKLNIPAAQTNGDYLQKVPLELSGLPTGDITINDEAFENGTSALTFNEAIGKITSVVFAGYGVEEGIYSDYKNLDVQGKYVFVKAGEPKNADGTYAISGNTENSAWSNMSEAPNKKAEIAEKKGALGIIYYDNSNFMRFKGYFDRMKTNAGGRMSIANSETSFAKIYVDNTIAKKLLSDVETNTTPTTIATNIDFNFKSNNTKVDSENVVAILKGSEKPEEYLVISSHLDHIGVNANGEINNGADDDGSGTVALLEIAEAFKTAADKGYGPKRSVVFLHVTGEEKGLLGSKYYTDFDPIFPLVNTVANLNIDMIGRIDPKREGDRNYLYLIGSDKLSTELHNLSEEVNNKYTNIEFDYTYNDENDPNRFYYRSDHYNFAKNNIPIIFYFNGTHDDYHQPGDTPDKINYDLLENRTRLVFYTAWEIANRPGRLIVDKAAN